MARNEAIARRAISVRCQDSAFAVSHTTNTFECVPRCEARPCGELVRMRAPPRTARHSSWRGSGMRSAIQCICVDSKITKYAPLLPGVWQLLAQLWERSTKALPSTLSLWNLKSSGIDCCGSLTAAWSAAFSSKTHFKPTSMLWRTSFPASVRCVCQLLWEFDSSLERCTLWQDSLQTWLCGMPTSLQCMNLTVAKSAVSANHHESLTAAQSAALSGKNRFKPASAVHQFLHTQQQQVLQLQCPSLTIAKSAVSANHHKSLTAAQSAALSGKTCFKPASAVYQFLRAPQILQLQCTSFAEAKSAVSANCHESLTAA
ncbi:hypothetical protein C8R45DRAFT_1076609 [Mycena sanguinolenta]|nr:hypothetical protein C8R45DRAFT_1076609 [Mycena sanguinolenta]